MVRWFGGRRQLMVRLARVGIDVKKKGFASRDRRDATRPHAQHPNVTADHGRNIITARYTGGKSAERAG